MHYALSIMHYALFCWAVLMNMRQTFLRRILTCSLLKAQYVLPNGMCSPCRAHNLSIPSI